MLVALLLAAATPGDGWTTYANPRFAFAICYPARQFTPGRASDNGDGLAFSARDGATLTTWGSNDALDQGIAGERAMAERDRGGITYRAAAANWFVVSGRSKDRTFYRKTFFADGRFVSFELSYPTTAAARYAAIVTRIQKCFRYGKLPA